MRYKQLRPTPAKNRNRTDLVRRISSVYEEKARDLNTNAINAAGFAVAYYRQLTHGRVCSCVNSLENDSILDENGDMSDEVMSNLLDNNLSSYDQQDSTQSDSFFQGMGDYNDSGELPKPFDELVVDFQNEEDLGVVDNSDGFNIRSVFDAEGNRAFSSSISNCPICNRIGLVGGYTLVDGFRRVYDFRNFFRLTNCFIDVDSAPYEIKRIGSEKEEGAEDLENDEPIVFRVKMTLPNNPVMLLPLRVMSGFKAINQRFITLKVATRSVEPFMFQEINGMNAVELFDGQSHILEITLDSSIKSFTHVEASCYQSKEGVFIDRSNINRSSSTKSFNDIDPVSISVPARVGQLRVRDIFFDRQTRLNMIVTSAEVYASALMTHAFMGTAERVKFSQEPYSLLDPYTYGYKESI